jgi:CRP-like cAMP-binding protein
MPNPIQLALVKLSSQTRLTIEETDALLALEGNRHSIGNGVDFVRAGQEADSVCLVIDGLVARTTFTRTGAHQITAFYVAGDIPDLHSLLQPEMTSSLRALTRCEIMCIPHAALSELAARLPGIMEAFWRYTIWDVAAAREWTTNVGKHPGQQRIAHLLCELAVKMGQQGDGEVSYKLPITQSVLAEATGLSAVHLNRSLQAMRKANLLKFEHSTVVIPDWKAFADWADFDDVYLKPGRPLRLFSQEMHPVPSRHFAIEQTAMN